MSDTDKNLKIQNNTSNPKYLKPKILLLDLEHKVEIKLKEEGYNVSTGSFGKPYKVPKTNNSMPLHFTHSFPKNLLEQEIIIIDLKAQESFGKLQGHEAVDGNGEGLLVSCKDGLIDPRPVTMHIFQENFDKILSHSGVLVIFAAETVTQAVYSIKSETYYGMRKTQNTLEFTTWDFLSKVHFETKNDYGTEIEIVPSRFSELLNTFSESSHFECTIDPTFLEQNNRWFTLAKNKYDEVVAGVILPKKDTSQNYIFIFPQVINKSEFLFIF